VRFKEHDRVDGTVISEVKQGRDGASVKLVDRQKSLAFLERYFELNPMDRHRREYDEKRLKLEENKQKAGNEDALKKLDEMLAGIDKVMQRD
jgi:phage terminase small subunit